MVGFGASAMRQSRQAQGCSWVWGNGTEVEGELKIRFNIVDFFKKVRVSRAGESWESSQISFLEKKGEHGRKRKRGEGLTGAALWNPFQAVRANFLLSSLLRPLPMLLAGPLQYVLMLVDLATYYFQFTSWNFLFTSCYLPFETRKSLLTSPSSHAPGSPAPCSTS